ncbi:MAG: phosphomannomutase [Zetaproteobacteria bacterium]|nr:MAG: phosphomannomutase [Zetaproteobacteria bacterium]
MEGIEIATLMRTSGVKFGTSGARGLVRAMSDRVCYAYTLAFLDWLQDSGQWPEQGAVALAGDFRPSTPRIMRAVASGIRTRGLEVINCGTIPTPALAHYALGKAIPSIMVTGSHIPDDRNGIKFYKPNGEILKDDEQAMIQRSIQLDESRFDADGQLRHAEPLPEVCPDARARYLARYLDVFPADSFAGLRIGVYEHSSVARDLLVEVFERLCADVIRLARSDTFIPVDTEAIRAEDIQLARQWSQEYALDAIVSADGDGDRPLLADEHGNWLRGDIAGILCARFLEADSIALPVSCNSAVEACGWFTHIERTRIGSPYVIAAMQHMPGNRVVGYEANGGFLTMCDIPLGKATLTALPTRDALIVPLAALMLAQRQGCSLSALCAQLPARFTYSDRLENFPTELSQAKLAPFYGQNGKGDIPAANALLEASLGKVQAIDTTDGVRMTLENGEIVHLRPSGNAPELRCYTEADTQARAIELNAQCMALLKQWRQA